MMKALKLSLLIAAVVLVGRTTAADTFVTELRSRGYALIPAPQQVELETGDIVVDRSWSVVAQGAAAGDIASEWLTQGARMLHGLEFQRTGGGQIVLGTVPGTVTGTNDPELLKQGYRIVIKPGMVSITGNDSPGLFYGVESLLQLLRRNSDGSLSLPRGTIDDWPDLQLRFAHWDTKHHQVRIESLKHMIDWLAYFKVNMIGFEMEDKYEYPSHPVIGAPGAYTKAQMQDLTRYALERHIQIVPVIQSPAHFSYVLKHPEFAHLKADGSNYQACMCDPETIKLIFDMYSDMIDATPGVKYFHVSTDEVYYAGICDKCGKPYNDENRSQVWIDFALKAHEFLKSKGRTMLAWVEYPVMPKHILQLPPDLIDGVMGGNQNFIDMEKQVGIRQLAYSSTQGGEYLFPNHFPTVYRGRYTRGRVEGVSTTVRDGLAMGANPIGSFAAAWDDSGLHEETFWLGWATVTQYAWTHLKPTPAQSTADFMDAFYGANHGDMVEVYNQLETGARFFEDGWESVISTERGSGYGNSYGPGIGTARHDDILFPPALPDKSTLKIEATFGPKYAEKIERARSLRDESDELIATLNSNLTMVERNRYNQEVYLSIAQLERHFIDTMIDLDRAEQSLLAASRSASEGDHRRAVANLVQANNTVSSLLERRKWMWDNLVKVWRKSRYEKGRSYAGRDFLQVLDDVKDHWAYRRKGLDYMLAPFQRIKLEAWRSDLEGIINGYAAAHNVPVRGLEEPRLED